MAAPTCERERVNAPRMRRPVRRRWQAGRAIGAVQWLLNQPTIGTKRKARIDKELRQERASRK